MEGEGSISSLTQGKLPPIHDPITLPNSDFDLIFRSRSDSDSDSDSESRRTMTKNIARLINKFNFDLNKVIMRDDDGGNRVFSPYSIYTTLATLIAGAEGETKTEIANALGWEDDDILSLLEMVSTLNNELLKGETKSFLDIAFRSWVGKDTEILRTHQDILIKYFDIEMGTEDFVHNAESARRKINAWVEEKTRYHIRSLFPDGSIDPTTKLVLANAIYFKGEWEDKFDKDDTKTDKFYITPKKTVRVKYMYKLVGVNANVDEKHNVQLLKLRYAGYKFYMLFVMPHATGDAKKPTKFEQLSKLEAKIKDTTKQIQQWNSIAAYSKYKIFVPKFKINLGMEMSSRLRRLGINDVFDEGRVNLSGVNGKRDLYVTSMYHKAFIKVDEEGTVATAVTGHARAKTCKRPRKPRPPEEIRLNHPFLFYIVHSDSDAIIFSGKVQNPNKGGGREGTTLQRSPSPDPSNQSSDESNRCVIC